MLQEFAGACRRAPNVESDDGKFDTRENVRVNLSSARCFSGHIRLRSELRVRLCTVCLCAYSEIARSGSTARRATIVRPSVHPAALYQKTWRRSRANIRAQCALL